MDGTRASRGAREFPLMSVGCHTGQNGFPLVQDRTGAGRAQSERAAGRIAQLVEQLTLNQRVQGSSPCAPTKPNQSPEQNLDDGGVPGRCIWDEADRLFSQGIRAGACKDRSDTAV
jgi:hypothetical protein